MKKNITIVTDSTWDRDNDEANKLGVKVVSLNVHFGDEQYLDGVEISNKEFLDRLKKSDVLPTTSQPSPIQFEEVFKKEIEKGNKILYIGVDSTLSGTFNSARIAKENIGSEDIYLVDSKTVTVGLGILVQIAIDLIQKFDDIEYVISKLEEIKKRIKIFAYVDTLKYLQKGGRLSATQAFLGGVLNLKPIIQVKDGVISSYDKARGKKAALNKMIEAVKNDGIDDNYPVAFANIDSDESINYLINEIKKFNELNNYWIQDLGSVVATHAGPGAAGIGYITK